MKRLDVRLHVHAQVLVSMSVFMMVFAIVVVHVHVCEYVRMHVLDICMYLSACVWLNCLCRCVGINMYSFACAYAYNSWMRAHVGVDAAVWGLCFSSYP